ncbi:MAG: AAA family ATPase [Candidatus Moraniibacteriota bacterium]|nr:MAG: AAA family ATPase [Candidatus Moranbacteria bacterium]
MTKTNRIPRVILINGPGAVGKTTLVELLCKKLPQPCIRINIDEIRHLITSRKQFPEISYPVARKFTKRILEEAVSDGFDVVIDKMLFDEPSYGEMASAIDIYRSVTLAQGGIFFEFILMADEDTLMKRAEKRGFRPDGSVTPTTVIEFHNAMKEFLTTRKDAIIIKTDNLNPPETLAYIWKIIENAS